MAVLTAEKIDLEAFIELPWQLHGHDPSWVPPIRARLRQELTGSDALGCYAD